MDAIARHTKRDIFVDACVSMLVEKTYDFI